MSQEDKKQEREFEPYEAGYAKSARAACRICKEKIEKGVLRLAVRFPAPGGHGLATHWHHFDCFWSKNRKYPSEENFAGFADLTPEDQDKLRAHFSEDASAEKASDFEVKGPVPKVEHAKTGSGKCFKCKAPIEEGHLRVSYTVSFYHPPCFAETELYKGAAESFDGFGSLTDEEQTTMKGLFKKPAGGAGKPKSTDSPGTSGASAAKKKPEKKEKSEKKEKEPKKPKDGGSEKGKKRKAKKEEEEDGEDEELGMRRKKKAVAAV